MIVVLGAGIVGLLTANCLADAGHSVTVIEREPGPAQACSKGNAGVIAVGHTDSWAGPKAPLGIIKAILGINPAIKVGSVIDWQLLRWGMVFLRNCNAAAHQSNSQSMMRLSLYSKELLAELSSKLKFDYSLQSNGSLYLFKNNQAFLERVNAIGGTDSCFQKLSVEEILNIDPALIGIADDLVGGFLSEVDASGDCYRFSELLAHHLAVNKKVKFLYGTEITGLKTTKDRVTGVETSLGEISCDNVVVALGYEACKLLRKIGLNPLIYPVKGYSATYPIVEPKSAPSISFIDETDLVGFARYGNRLRITAMAEFDKGSLELSPQRLEVLDRYAEATFGKAVDLSKAEYWAGSRPTTPSGRPYIGKICKYENLWINAGHGQLGWTMAAGSGQIISDLISGLPPAVTGVSESARWLEQI